MWKNLLIGIKISMKNKIKYPDLNKCVVAIIGLGYVGLPLAIEFAKKQKCHISGKDINRQVIGFDINSERIEQLKKGNDITNEINKKELLDANLKSLTNQIKIIAQADIFIVTVPTPINEFNEPDLEPLKKATSTVAKALKIRSKRLNKCIPIVIYESTVYPGTTEEICIPIIEQESDLICNGSNLKDAFVCGYSPERINPGDKKHRLKDIVKITSGSNKEAASWIDFFYGSIIKAGTHLTKDIKTAEAAKIIENTQRDINIALMNELSIIFKLLNIDTLEVLEAASTKWNFIKFTPGLVGGHCIGVDPYYLTYKAQALGYKPEIVLAGRYLNDGMSKWVSEQLILAMNKSNIFLPEAKVLILGFTFKENCPDIRNTKIFDIVKILKEYKLNIDIIDPWVNPAIAKKVYDLKISKNIPKDKKYNAVLCTLAHQTFIDMKESDWSNIIKNKGIIFDLKGIVPRSLNPIRI